MVTDDGGEAELSPGEAYEVQPGHDACVVGEETPLNCMCVEAPLQVAQELAAALAASPALARTV